jgi:hypothetical protein
MDIVSSQTLSLKSHLQMSTWFRSFEFDAFGHFLNFDFLDQTMNVYDNNGRLTNELQLAEPIAENQKIKYCCTNDGRLLILRNNIHLEIY